MLLLVAQDSLSIYAIATVRRMPLMPCLSHNPLIHYRLPSKTEKESRNTLDIAIFANLSLHVHFPVRPDLSSRRLWG